MSNHGTNELVRRLASISAPTPKNLSALLGSPARHQGSTRLWMSYRFDVPNSIFAYAEARIHVLENRARLSLRTDGSTPTFQLDLLLNEWGSVEHIDVNPRIPPEGTDSYRFTVSGTRVTFQLTHHSKQLRSVSLRWGGRGT